MQVICPTCRQPFDPQLSAKMPFCSDRCRQIDLGRWLGEEYSLPITRDPDAEEAGDSESAD